MAETKLIDFFEACKSDDCGYIHVLNKWKKFIGKEYFSSDRIRLDPDWQNLYVAFKVSPKVYKAKHGYYDPDEYPPLIITYHEGIGITVCISGKSNIGNPEGYITTLGELKLLVEEHLIQPYQEYWAIPEDITVANLYLMIKQLQEEVRELKRR